MGNARLLRRLRRFAPYPLIGAALWWLQPVEALGSDRADLVLDLLGLLLAFAGEALRFWTWGANAVPGMFRIRTEGPYKLLRHPLYAGNFLIVCGMFLVFGNPWATLAGATAFAALYAVVVRREEHQLVASSDLGPDYADYMRVHHNRFLPQMSHWRAALSPAHGFDWRLAAEKEYEAVLGILLGWVALDFFEEQFVWRGASHGATLIAIQVALLAVVAVAAPLLWRMKRRRPKPMPPLAAAAVTPPPIPDESR